MAGARVELELDNSQVLAAVSAALAELADPQLLLQDIGEMLVNSTRDRFSAQRGPDGQAWQALSPRYLKNKSPNPGKILQRRGDLVRQIFPQVAGNTLLVGTDRIYGAIHQFGGDIQRQARESEVYFKRDTRTGEVGRHFVSREKSNFAQRVSIGAHTIHIPARPFLGISAEDAEEILAIIHDHLQARLQG